MTPSPRHGSHTVDTTPASGETLLEITLDTAADST